MEQQTNNTVGEDTAGVLPMDTGAVSNGVHDKTDKQSSSNTAQKKGRGRPPKVLDSKKETIIADRAKRGRGRPPKSASVPTKPKVEPMNNDDKNGRRRGRPSKKNTSNEQANDLSKSQVSSPSVKRDHQSENGEDSTKKKRGRPARSSQTKVSVVTSFSKIVTTGRKRGRPSGSAKAKKFIAKPKTSVVNSGSIKKRGRPKKSNGSSTAHQISSKATEAVTTNTT